MNHESTNEVLRDLLLRLERVQREVGEVQSILIRLLGGEQGQPPVSLDSTVEEMEEVGELEEESAVSSSEPTERPTVCINPATWLAQRRVTVLRQSPPSELNEVLDKLATFLGERFQNIRPFYEAVKRRIGGQSHSRAVRLAQSPPRVISDVCQFGTLLYEHGFLSRYHYDRNTRTLFFVPQDDGRVTNFFTGDWLERYVLLTALERAKTLLPQEVEPIVLTKAVVALPDGQETELDILLGLPDRVLWLECKTSEDWQEHATKFGRIAKCLNLPTHRAALVLLESLGPTQKQAAATLARMTVINPEELEGFIEAALTDTVFRPVVSAINAPPVSPPTPAPAAVLPTVTSAYVTWLKKMGLRPLDPATRRQIVQDLVRLNAAESLPLPELSRQLQTYYQACGSRISKNQINDVTNALRRAGLCEWRSHPDYPNGMWFLRSDVGAEEMLKQCSLLYLWTLMKNPAWATLRQLDAGAVADLLRWGLESDRLEPLLDEMTAQGKCVQQGDDWVAVGNSFVPLPAP
ncbi:MAG: hypothetical protein NZT92_14055 [Abditibacteriales bacterium]|nr:hypothetical protein [Abditibacteriales bacterium]MDW8366252.1 hypothetical protein [Abditibacteriales bacterium]